MSLMDALLNEGYRDPRNVYIALRTDLSHPNVFLYPQVPLRNNLVAQLEGPLSERAYGVYSSQIGNGIIEENVLLLAGQHLLVHRSPVSGTVSYLENQGPTATPVLGEAYGADNRFSPMGDVRTLIEDTLLMAF